MAAGSDISSKRRSSKRKRGRAQKKSRRVKRRRDDSSDSSYSSDKSFSPERASNSKRKKRIHKNRKLSDGHSTTSSSSYDDWAMSSHSGSSSSDYRRKKVTRSRLKLKSIKKRTHRGKKRKRSGRYGAGKPKYKSSKKKAKKYSSSDTESCSTCRSTSSGNTDYKDCGKIEIKSRSSSCERCNKRNVRAGHDDVALLPVVHNSRRLKSVITFADDHRYDQHEEEITYDQADYPSLRSPNSNEDGTKTDLGDDRSQGDSEEADNNNVDNGEEIHASVLESILRQRALENLNKFRGALQTGPKGPNLVTSDESNANKSTDTVASLDFRLVNQSSGLSEINNLSNREESKRLPDCENVEKQHGIGITTHIADHPNDGPMLLGCSKADNSVGSDAGRSKADSRIDTCRGGETLNPNIQSNMEPMCGEHKLEHEAKDASSFEQKTMSVMRGGEMLQVSYKVYIPKRAPALARRQLNR